MILKAVLRLTKAAIEAIINLNSPSYIIFRHRKRGVLSLPKAERRALCCELFMRNVRNVALEPERKICVKDK